MLAEEIRVYNQEQTNHLGFGEEETKNPESQEPEVQISRNSI